MDIISHAVIPDVLIIDSSLYEDERGYFTETYRDDWFRDIKFVQDNLSRSKGGVVRGIHYQAGDLAQSKLVKVVMGCVIDIAVDIRPYSKTYGRWVSVLLSDENNKEIFIPKGFAHGFYAYKDSIVTYKVDNYFSKEHERTIKYDDETLDIFWGFAKGYKPIVSEKDNNGLSFKDIDKSEIL